MVSKFKSLSALEEILARGQFWETIPTLEAISAKRRFGPGNYPSTRYVFLDFLLFLFYIVNFYLFILIVLYIY